MTRLVALGLMAGTLLGPRLAAANTHLPLLTLPAPPRKANQPIIKTLTNQVLFLNRCVGGCTVTPGADNPNNDTSAIATIASAINEFNWDPGEWEGILQCVKDIYSPYMVTVTRGPRHRAVVRDRVHRSELRAAQPDGRVRVPRRRR